MPKQKSNLSILALDPGTFTGFAIRFPHGDIHSGVAIFAKVRDPGERWRRFRQFLYDYPAIDLLIYEEPFIHPKHRSGWGLLYGFKTIIELFCTERTVQLYSIAPSILKAWATGDGHAKKNKMQLYARHMGWKFKDDNECDARWLLHYAERVVLGKDNAT